MSLLGLSSCRVLVNSGRDRISDHYYVDFEVYSVGMGVFGGTRRINQLYFVDHEDGNKGRLIGALGGGYNLAISDNGRSVVFYHARRASPLFEGTGKFRPRGLYAFRPEDGLRLVVRGKDIGYLYNADLSDWQTSLDEQYGTGQARIAGYLPLPGDVLKFCYAADSDLRWSQMAITAEGKVLPLPCLGGNALHTASYDGDAALVMALLSDGVDPGGRTFFGLTALDIAIAQNHQDIAINIIESVSSFDRFSRQTFLSAATYARIALLQPLLDAGCPMVRDAAGVHPLSLALLPGNSTQALSDVFRERDPED